MKEAWYKQWFDSPYYNILYQNRDKAEARLLIDALQQELQMPKGAKVLDLACGRGRHAIYLARKGFEVTGVDLSPQSINYAAQYEQENLSFYIMDMRHPFRINYFDYTFNFFTSFGYFASEKDHLKALQSVQAGLRKNGMFVLDYFNSRLIRKKVVEQEQKQIQGIQFDIRKEIKHQAIHKTIQIQDGEAAFQITERVKLFELVDFEHLFEQSGLQLKKVFGNYQLDAFEPDVSPRLILIAQKR